MHLLYTCWPLVAPAGCRETNATAALSPPHRADSSSSSVRGKNRFDLLRRHLLSPVSKEAPAPSAWITPRLRSPSFLPSFSFFISTAFNVFGKFSKVPTARGEPSKREMSPKHLRIESVLSRRDVEKWRQRIMPMRCRDFSIERS